MKCQMPGCTNEITFPYKTNYKGKEICYSCRDLLLYYAVEDFGCSYEN